MAIGNPERGELTLVVNGTSYVLKLTMKALVALQKKTGKKLGMILEDITRLDVEALAAVVWAMLQTHHAADFTQEESVFTFIDQAGGPGEVIRVVGEALIAGMSPAKTTAGAPSPQ